MTTTPESGSGPAPEEAAFDAVRNGDIDRLSSALDRGAPANLCNEAGDSLLMLAAYHGHEACVAHLLERGADPDRLNHKGQHPLAGVCFKGNLAIATALLDAGANPEGSPASSRSPLMYAAMYNHRAITLALLERGADPGRRSGEGKRALELAEEMRAVHTVALLRERDGTSPS